MKTIVLLSSWLLACGSGFIGFGVSAQMVDSGSSGRGGGTEPSRCLTDARIQVTANPTKVTYGQASTVQWSVDLPARCSSVQVRFNGDPVSKSGSRSVTPPSTSTYIVLVSTTQGGVYGETSASAQVEVTFPPRVVIDPSTVSPVRVLLGALSDPTNPEQTVELCNVELDLTGITGIAIGDNRSLIGAPGCERTPRRFGPRIFVTDKRGNSPLFVIQGDHVRFSGFRLEGPTSDIAQGDVKERGIVISPVASPDPIRNIEISNMEIFHWSGAGLEVDDNVDKAERGRLFNTNPGAVRISGSFFHHNRHGAGFGYGVDVDNGAYALIEQNVFDENRHAIAGGSRNANALDYSGYTVRDNLILAGGGVHCLDSAGTGATVGGVIGGILGGIIGGLLGGPAGAGIGAGIGAGVGAGIGGLVGSSACWHTHQIDMHGDQNEWYSSNNFECGTAGETMIIQRNTVLYTEGNAIHIRGNPADKAVVDGNVFKNERISDTILHSGAIAQNGNCGFGDNISNPIDVRPNNVFGADPMAELGSCDFFGDGQEDQFMATGVTWWALSPVTLQWRYLNTMPERLPELQLAKIDGDAVCDVAPRSRDPAKPPEKYSKSGTGPWVTPHVLHP